MHFQDIDTISDQTITKKERDMIEVTKLIQKATETTKNLFENSDNFKFRLKSDDK